MHRIRVACLALLALAGFGASAPAAGQALLGSFDVNEGKRGEVPAITHVDGTARVQTVGRGESPLYHRLIGEFARRTGVPMVLNTSMNVQDQPIIADPRTAIALFYSTGLVGMAIGPYYLRKQA